MSEQSRISALRGLKLPDDTVRWIASKNGVLAGGLLADSWSEIRACFPDLLIDSLLQRCCGIPNLQEQYLSSDMQRSNCWRRPCRSVANMVQDKVRDTTLIMTVCAQNCHGGLRSGNLLQPSNFMAATLANGKVGGKWLCQFCLLLEEGDESPSVFSIRGLKGLRHPYWVYAYHST